MLGNKCDRSCFSYAATEDLKRKMYSCVLVVGSGMKFQGIGMWLHNRISLQIPYMYRAGTFSFARQRAT